MSYKLVYTRQAWKDAKKLKGSHIAKKAKELLELIKERPFVDPTPFEALVGDLSGHIRGVLTFSTDWCMRFLKMNRQSRC